MRSALFGVLLDLGFAVAIVDWRSQGGSGRTLPDVGKVHVRSFEDYQRDFNAFVQKVVMVECAPPYYCRAHSGGALNCINAMATGPHCFDRAIAMAPP